ncbi:MULTISPECIES: glycosyltransferase [unclassified Flavobacterium]|uniref:glycosyltransferase family 2 protein n=1 Tax=unclassified Flavobacterium TaxID=196869 RepID=UPI00086C7E5B|nr:MULTISPECIES: glycosyltransferase [unclassified Flavobacterium]MBN9283631.1 glycosyltransferase [Flavobacterium sp.]ODS86153.1 MAG: glycosyl transferase [Chryseobacterium sp. SCN 40-13]OJV69259.1 MAG: glycosyl transferase [Flavobacterium sp. 40-81]
MEILILFFCLVFIDYTLFIGLLVYGFSKVQSFQKKELPVRTTFSIVVPFRNEAGNLPDLLHSLTALNYPEALFEIIFVDDASEDESVRIINNWRMEHTAFHVTILDNVRTTNAPKKDAITRAVSVTKKDWIITTDADCILPAEWLSTFDNCIQQNNAELIVGAVTFQKKSGLLSHFQQMDMLSLQGATIGSFGLDEAFMCNGANLAYSKKLFYDLKGFEGNTALASGDDVFLLQKAIRAVPEKVCYLKSEAAIVTTKPLRSWWALFFQRVRWASKSAAYQTDFPKGLALVVFLTNLCLVLSLWLVICHWMDWRYLLAFYLLKFTVDFILMFQTNRFLKMAMISVIISSILYPFFCVKVALYSLIGRYSWKGRTFKA